jgi:hypothetical protein
MELELKKADIYMIESGDILVFKIEHELSQEQSKRVIEALNQLERKVESVSGKKICTMLANIETDLSLYRKVEGG